MPRILIIEEDENINSLLSSALMKNGHEIEYAKDGLTGCYLTMRNDYQLIFLDLMIPQKDSIEILRELRRRKSTPVIVLSDKNADYNRIQVLRFGANDYINKPFSTDEVAWRVKELLRRAEGASAILAFKDMRIDTSVRRVFIGEQEMICSAMEYYILELMLSHPQQTFSKKNLFESVTGEEYINYENTMNVHISNLRKKIARITKECYIKTMYGVGYRLGN